MGTIKIFSLGGIDKNSNDLTRQSDKASDMLNMEYNTESTIKKRTGQDLAYTTTHSDTVYYSYKDEKLHFTNGSSTVKIYDSNNNLKTLTMPFTVTVADISSCESQNNLYFTSTDLSIPVMKYDGSNIYRAGLPTPRQQNFQVPSLSSGASTGVHLRVLYSFKDMNGNVTYSPYYQIDDFDIGASAVLSVNSLAIDPTSGAENGFLSRYCWYNLATPSTISSASRTLTVQKHNYIAGDKFIFENDTGISGAGLGGRISITPSGRTFIVLDVESVTSTTITFTASSFGAYSITLIADASPGHVGYPVDIRTKIIIYRSTSSDTGYSLYGEFVLDGGVVTNVQQFVDLQKPSTSSFFLSGIPFEDVYDSTTLKIMPPYCKHIAAYGDQIIYGNIDRVFSLKNTATAYNNNDLIIYSDVSTGDGPENISELNRQKIGETWDGQITGMRRANDSLMIFKDHGVFSIDGVLIQGQYQLRKINSNYVGCTSHKSIIDAEEGVYFQGHNGIYFTNAINIKKMTFELDSYFNSLNYDKTRAVRVKKKQKALFYIDSSDGSFTDKKIVVIDYYYGQVYFWDSIVPNAGFIETSSGDVYVANGTTVNKFNFTSYSDVGNAINAYYKTTWHHAGEPSLNKKWLSIRTFGLTPDQFTATISVEKEWGAGTIVQQVTQQYLSADQTKFTMFDMQTSRSLRVTFSNDVLNEGMVITGYEIGWEPYNVVDKN